MQRKNFIETNWQLITGAGLLAGLIGIISPSLFENSPYVKYVFIGVIILGAFTVFKKAGNTQARPDIDSSSYPPRKEYRQDVHRDEDRPAHEQAHEPHHQYPSQPRYSASQEFDQIVESMREAPHPQRKRNLAEEVKLEKEYREAQELEKLKKEAAKRDALKAPAIKQYDEP